MPLFPQLAEYVAQRQQEFGQIPAERQRDLAQLAQFVRQRMAAGEPTRLTFICTHNSRRSHLGQIWAAVAAATYGVPKVETFSGGTEATAFNPRAVAALRRAGLAIEATSDEPNPRYEVRFAEQASPLVCFSKVYSSPPNPQQGFCAVMTCTQADQGCPVVAGASQRLSLPYEDPKVADDTPDETARYDERCAQIARELLFAFSRVQE